jgi:hypothetical protein
VVSGHEIDIDAPQNTDVKNSVPTIRRSTVLRSTLDQALDYLERTGSGTPSPRFWI